MLNSRLVIRYPVTETSALTRSGHSAAMMSPVRDPQSNPASTARRILSASIRARMSRAKAAWSTLRGVAADRNVVLPWPRKYGTITR